MFRRSCFIVLLILCAGRSADGAIRFELPEVITTVNAGAPTTGIVDVVVRADPADLPMQIGGFNVDFQSEDPVTFDVPQAAPNPLISGMPLDFSPDNEPIVRAALDDFDSPSALFDGAGLVRVMFQVPAEVTGTFDLTFGAFNQLANGMAEAIPFQTNDVGSIIVSIAGDYNGNGSVGPEDYGVWQNDFGSTTSIAADGNHNGIVDAADYVIWRDNLPLSSGLTAASAFSAQPYAVPEPGLCALAISGSIFWHILTVCRTRRRRPR